MIAREHSNLLKGSAIVFISGVSDANRSSSLDHYAVLFHLNVNRPKIVHKSVKFRAFRNIPVPTYRNDVKVVLNNQSTTPENINDLIDYYNSTLQNFADKYAPLQCKEQIVQNMYRRRNEKLVKAKSTYFTNKVEESKDDIKALFRLTRNMMGNSGDKILPLHTCKRKLAYDVSALLYNKIVNIQSDLELTDTHTCGSATTCFSLEFH